MESAPLRILAMPILVAALAGCSSTSQVAELSPDLFGLTTHASTSAAAARIGVEQARQHCAAQGRAFQPTRTEIGARDYTIAFRCPRPEPEPQAAAALPGLAPYLAPEPAPAALPARRDASAASGQTY